MRDAAVVALVGVVCALMGVGVGYLLGYAERTRRR